MAEFYLKSILKAQLSVALCCDSGGLSMFIIKLGHIASRHICVEEGSAVISEPDIQRAG